MKKYFLTALFTISFLATQAQSNKKGTFHIGLGMAVEALGGSERYKSYSPPPVSAGQFLTLKSSYSFSNRIGAGLYIRREYRSFIDYQLISTTIGIEGKYYAINKNKFNLYISPAIGYLSGQETNYTPTQAKATGMNYCFSVGFNWYWTQHFGMCFDAGYSHLDLHFQDGVNYGLINSSPSYNGAIFNLGLITKFGGK